MQEKCYSTSYISKSIFCVFPESLSILISSIEPVFPSQAYYVECHGVLAVALPMKTTNIPL